MNFVLLLSKKSFLLFHAVFHTLKKRKAIFLSEPQTIDCQLQLAGRWGPNESFQPWSTVPALGGAVCSCGQPQKNTYRDWGPEPGLQEAGHETAVTAAVVRLG